IPAPRRKRWSQTAVLSRSGQDYGSSLPPRFEEEGTSGPGMCDPGQFIKHVVHTHAKPEAWRGLPVELQVDEVPGVLRAVDMRGRVSVVEATKTLRGMSPADTCRQRVAELVVEQQVGAPARHAWPELAFQHGIDAV